MIDIFGDHSFANRIADAQRDIDNLVAEKNRADSKRQQSQDAYNTFFGNMRDYSSLNDEAENEFGVKTAMENYEKSKFAVAAVEQRIDMLPSAINRTSNVVMSQQRRELAFNAAADKWSENMRTQQKQMDVNKDVWDKARANANIYAERLYGEQQDVLKSLALQWSANTGLFQKATENWQKARALKLSLDSEYNSFKALQSQIQNQNNQFDFGNGYVLKKDANNEATYYKDGHRITAGQFVEGTGANGANWNMWNDVWGKGISTKGVGSDTIEAFNRMSSANPKYNYLFTYF